MDGSSSKKPGTGIPRRRRRRRLSGRSYLVITRSSTRHVVLCNTSAESSRLNVTLSLFHVRAHTHTHAYKIVLVIIFYFQHTQLQYIVVLHDKYYINYNRILIDLLHNNIQ